jgi:copper chaperone
MQETFTAPAISCEHCKTAIEGVLLPIKGVETADVDIDSKRVTVAYDPEVTPRETPIVAMAAEGYPVSA